MAWFFAELSPCLVGLVDNLLKVSAAGALGIVGKAVAISTGNYEDSLLNPFLFRFSAPLARCKNAPGLPFQGHQPVFAADWPADRLGPP